MSITIKSTGLIGLYRDGVLISEHNAEVIVSLLQKTVIPFSWGQPTLGFSQGTAGSVDLAVFLVNPEGRSIVYSVVGALPSGVTLNGSTLAYNGSGPVASNTVSLVASSGGFESTSSPVTVTIVLGNVAPQFTVAPATSSLPASGGMIQFTAVDPNGDAVTYSLTTTRAGIAINNSGLVTVSAVAAGTSGAIVVRAADPQGAYAQTSCSVTVSAAPVGDALKFNPGHYVMIWSWTSEWDTQAKRFAFYDTLANETHVKGVLLWDAHWGIWESTQGNYTSGFARLDAEVAYLAAMGKRLMVRLWPWSGSSSSNIPTVNTGDQAGKPLVPSYLQNSTYAGGAVRNSSGWIYTADWNTPCMDRYIALVQAYGARYDSNPRVEMAWFGIESSYSFTAGTEPAGYSQNVKADSNMRLLTAMRAAWPTTMVHASVSWMYKVREWVQLVQTLRATGGSEDLLPGDDVAYPGSPIGRHDGCSWATNEYMGRPWSGGGESSSMNDRRGIVSHLDLNEGPVYGSKDGSYLPSEVFQQCNTQRQTHMVWIKMYARPSAQPTDYDRTDMTWAEYRQRAQWLGSYGGQPVGILPFIRTNPAFTQTSAPTSLLPVQAGGG